MALLLLLALLGAPPSIPIAVRYVEGSLHGFLVLKDQRGTPIAHGDLLQEVHGEEVTARTVFQFTDGSLYDETVVFSQHSAFIVQRYHLVTRGPAFNDDGDITFGREGGKYRVVTRAHSSGKEKVLEGSIELPLDVYNGMAIIVAKNLARGQRDTVHYIAFTPEPRMIGLEFVPGAGDSVRLGSVSQPALHYVLKPQLGAWLKLFASLLGRMPPDQHIWIDAAHVPVFLRFEGPLVIGGPVWRIELTSPKWRTEGEPETGARDSDHGRPGRRAYLPGSRSP